MKVKATKPEHIPEIVKIYDKARAFMRKSGNLHQWNDNYPNEESLIPFDRHICHIITAKFFVKC